MRIQDLANVLLNKFNEYKRIALFVHMQPDFDAMASVFGFKQWLKDNFPDIQTSIMIPQSDIKDRDKDLFNVDSELPNEKWLQESLGIILDTANKERILTGLYIHCQELITIDHHPPTQSFAEFEFIDPTYPAASQILAELFLYWEQPENGNYLFKESVAQYFYAGIITDTNNFLSMSMIPSTYNILSKLISKGLNRSYIHNKIFEKTFSQKRLEMQIINNCYMTKNGLIFSIIGPEDIAKYGVDDIPNMVSVLENVSGVEVWSTLTYSPEDKIWKCSIRSKNLSVNNIAKLYKGGGHKKMAAATFKNKISYFQMLATLDSFLNSHGFENTTISDSRRNIWLWLIQFTRAYKKM